MSEMVERVAKALMLSRGGCNVTDWNEAEQNPNVAAALSDARAAIEAMREPTQSMLVATEYVVTGYADFAIGDGTLYLSYEGFHDTAIEAWQAMIDAALKD